MKNKEIMYVEVPREIWDASVSMWSSLFNKDIFGAWAKSIVDVVKQKDTQSKQKDIQIAKDVFEHCWNHPNWKGQYDIRDMEDYLKNYNQNK
jgi:hypothetical protein